MEGGATIDTERISVSGRRLRISIRFHALTSPQEDGSMPYIVIGFGGLAVLAAAGWYYLGHSNSRRTISTTEWVKLMRENDARTAARMKRKAAKQRPPNAHA
jgi:hypothetical protein